MRFAAGIVPNGVFSEKVVDAFSVLARESAKRSTCTTCVAPALAKSLQLLFLISSAPAHLSGSHGCRSCTWPAATAKHQMSTQPMMEGGRSYCCPAWCMLSSASYVLQELASLPPLFLDWNTKLQFAVPLSLLTSDHLFWAEPLAPRHVEFLARVSRSASLECVVVIAFRRVFLRTPTKDKEDSLVRPRSCSFFVRPFELGAAHLCPWCRVETDHCWRLWSSPRQPHVSRSCTRLIRCARARSCCQLSCARRCMGRSRC
jgi:hypothetical protein